MNGGANGQAAAASSSGLLAPWWTLALPLWTLGALIISPPERRMWAAPLAVAVFALIQWVLPRSRFRTNHYMGPVNIALMLLLLKLVVMPPLIMLTGPDSKVLTYLPSSASIQNAILLDIVAYAAFCVGLSLRSEKGAHEGGGAPLAALSGPGPGGGIVTAFAILGVIGFLAAFGSPARIIEYFMDPTAKIEEEANLVALAGTFFRPFLAFALVAWWAREVDSSKDGGNIWWLTLAGLAAATGVTIANLTFSFNRAAFVFPLSSLFVVYSARVKKIPVGAVGVAMLVAFPVLMSVETVRSDRMRGTTTELEFHWESMLKEVGENIKGYGGGPQFSAIFCERLGWGERLYGGSTLLASVMSPVPVLGKGFREGSGPTLFNQAIYDVKDIEDQILPFSTELFVNFHLLGVVAGFMLLGWFLMAAHGWFENAESAFAAFSIQYVAMWGAMLASWSASIFSQITIYFFGPIYFYVACTYGLRWLRSLGQARISRARQGVAA